MTLAEPFCGQLTTPGNLLKFSGIPKPKGKISCCSVFTCARAGASLGSAVTWCYQLTHNLTIWITSQMASSPSESDSVQLTRQEGRSRKQRNEVPPLAHLELWHWRITRNR